jgi:hypothetical protein
MKSILIFVGLWLALTFYGVEAQVVKDTLLDYYQAIKSGDTLGDGAPHYSPKTRIYVFQADFTGDGKESIFITDDESRQGPHGLYGWFVYYPVSSNSYQRLDDGISAFRTGPNYIGYVDQIKRYGIIIGGRDGIGVYYLDNGIIKSQPLDLQRGHADATHYPKYFHAHTPDYPIVTYTLAQLEQKYANPDPTNVITPAAK